MLVICITQEMGRSEICGSGQGQRPKKERKMPLTPPNPENLKHFRNFVSRAEVSDQILIYHTTHRQIHEQGEKFQYKSPDPSFSR